MVYTREKEVSALNLYKFMPPSFVQESSTNELVPSDTNSASANLNTLNYETARIFEQKMLSALLLDLLPFEFNFSNYCAIIPNSA